MGSKSIKLLAFLFLLNLIFLTLVSACDECPKPKPKKPKCPPTPPKTKPPPKPKSPKSPPKPKSPKSPPPPPAVESPKATCPTGLQLKACVGLLNIIGINLGGSSEKCCPLIAGLADLEAAACLCTAVKVEIPGIINLTVPVNINAILTQCQKTCPKNFQCFY
ncbi:OLC1v1031904C1 [Oldenlandia corymbosa var. corymbosa]|uniref:OLC1v1031904C1 n=1 Tax=Oldenlandia corymbosa var. corymbosa TaxID=529605 RepID=A0AAV1CMF8_OLDCO|nr:OLC1v1031904C1 [Oldenlandia corymbosa var. corymbosa]